MAHSYVDYFKRHVLLRDEHIVWLMASVIKESGSTQITPELDGLFTSWKNKWNAYGPGCVEVPLNDFLRDSRSVEQLIEILNSIESNLLSSGPVVAGEEMNKNVPSSRFYFEDQSTASLCDVINKFRDLLELGQCDLR